MGSINGVIFKSTISKDTYENIVIWQNLSGIVKQIPKSLRSWVEVNIYAIFIMKSQRNILPLLHFMYITTLSTMKLTLLLAEILLLQNSRSKINAFFFWFRTEYPAKTIQRWSLELHVRNNSIFRWHKLISGGGGEIIRKLLPNYTQHLDNIILLS